MRRSILPLLLIAAFALAGAGRARRSTGDSPAAALGRLKRAVGSNDFTMEWALLSPGFKQRMSKRAGRSIDLGDYVVFRRKQMRNPQVRQVKSYMRTARMTGIRYSGKGYASASITFGGPLFFGRTIRVRMVQHRLWRLEIKGESQPYWGFVGDKSMTVKKTPEGGYTIRSLDPKGKVTWEETFAADRIVRYREFGKWFFDHFGRMETQFFGA